MVSWVVFGADVAVFAACFIPTLEATGAQIAVGICWSLSVIALVAATAVATRCDPSDPHILSQKAVPLEENDDDLAFCMTCNSYVFPRSKHCRACDKCVHVFDHHCKWLNNCVGRFNYAAFFTSISSVVVMTGIILGVCGQLLAEHFMEDEVETRFRKIYKGAPDDLPLGLIIVMLVINLPLFLLDLQLVLLHSFLIKKQLTTYEYIMIQRDKETSEPPPPPEGAKYQADVQPSSDAGTASEINGEGASGAADAEKGDAGTKKKKKGPQGRVLPKIGKLPRCLDWFLFNKKRKKPAASSSNGDSGGSQPEAIPDAAPSPPDPATAGGASEAEPESEAGCEDAEAGSAARRGSGNRKLGAVVPLVDDGSPSGCEDLDDAPSMPVVPPTAVASAAQPQGAADSDSQEREPSSADSNRGVAATLGCGGSASVNTDPAAGTKI